MEINPSKNESIEKYLEETIYEYLKSQKDLPEYDFAEINEFVDTEDQTKKDDFLIPNILEELLNNVDKTILFQEKYRRSQRDHHQYGLFDLEDIIPEFYLDDEIIRSICFRETLLISNIDEPSETKSASVKPKTEGGLCLRIELAQGIETSPKLTKSEKEKKTEETILRIKQEIAQNPQNTDSESDEKKLKKYEEYLQEEMKKASKKFVVHLSSEFDVDGQNAGSRIISWVDRQFHTLEERRKEYFFNDEKLPSEQILYYALQENKYYIKHTSKLEEEHEVRKYYNLSTTKDMIGEGANFILMRYLAVTRYKGIFEMSTMYINGDMCRNIYECKGPMMGQVNEEPVELCKIYRTVIEECGINHCSVTALTVYGTIISQEWDGCPYILHVNPLLVTFGKPVPYDYLALKKVWQTNMELISKYLDCKTEAELKMKTYLKDHPEVNDMMADYIQSVLLLKPDNIMPFTIDYFINFEPYKLPQLPYFDDQFDNKEQEESDMFW